MKTVGMTQGRDDKQLMRNDLGHVPNSANSFDQTFTVSLGKDTVTKMLTKNQRCKISDEHLKTQ